MGKRGMVDGAVSGKQKLKISSHDHQPLDSIFASEAPPKYNHGSGSRTMLNFGAVGGVDKSGNSFFQSYDHEEIVGDYLDEYLNQPEKKRRLSEDQVQFLERSFEAENKLEPERRVQLAKELGLQPRQIAIWFQNRRARWKTRQLETDYETLHTNFNSLKTDYDNLMKENEMLKNEVLRLRHNNELSESMPKEVMADMISEDDEAKLSEVVSKNDEQSSAKSDSTNGINSFLLESGDSSQFLEPDQSDLSQNGEDDFKEDLFQLDHIFPKTEDARCHPTPGSFYYGFPIEDHASDFWSY